MDAILIKILAMGLALAQVTTRPEAVKTEFDPVKDQPEIVSLLRDGCAHFRKAFDIEAVNLDDLIATAMDDPKAVDSRIEALHGLKFDDLLKVYKQFCKGSTDLPSSEELAELAKFYNETLAGLPDHSKLKEEVMLGQTEVLDAKGERFAAMGDPSHQRSWIPLTYIPDTVQRAFVAAEDKRFFQHGGGDERGLIRALVGNLAVPGRPQGGSTITQQVAENLLVGGDVTLERKIRELVIASRIERAYPKLEILEIYLNSIYFGRGAWGIEMAARNYFNKSAKELTLAEGSLLAALIKGPGYFNPDRYPERARDRQNYVLQRMVEDGVIKPEQMREALASASTLVDYNSPRRNAGFYFVDNVGREAKDLAGIESLTQSIYTVRSTLQPDLQMAVEVALQDGLARFERQSGRIEYNGPEANLTDAIKKIEDERTAAAKKTAGLAEGGPEAAAPDPAWLLALRDARLPLYDVHWSPVVVVEGPGEKRKGSIRVGLSDGRVLPLDVPTRKIQDALTLNDVVYAHIDDGEAPKAEMRIRPIVQGAAVVLDSRTGKILAMVGGFSYPLSQLNRSTQSWRQPGSALKPVSYLAALKADSVQSPSSTTRPSRSRRSTAPRKRITGRRRIIAAALLARSRWSRRWSVPGTSPRFTCSTAALPRRRKRASSACARSRWKQSSTTSASRSSPSCSARSRYGSSTLPHSMPASPMRASGRRPMPSKFDYRQGSDPLPARALFISDRSARSGEVRPAQDDASRCRGERHRDVTSGLRAIRRGQNRYNRRRGRYLVRRLQQRRHCRRLGRL